MKKTDVDKEFFKHDYGSRLSPEMLKLRMKEGMSGVGIYWCIIEQLFENGGTIKLADVAAIAYELRIDGEEEKVQRVINDYGLFVTNQETCEFTARTVQEQLKHRKERSESAKRSIAKRWERNQEDAETASTKKDAAEKSSVQQKEESFPADSPQKCEENTNVIRTYNDRNTNVIQRREEESREGKSRVEREKRDIAAQTRLSLPQKKFHDAFPDKSIDAPIPDDLNLDAFIEKIRESDFLVRNKNLGLSWCLTNKDRILSGEYKDYAKPQRQNYEQREYTAEFLNGFFSDD